MEISRIVGQPIGLAHEQEAVGEGAKAKGKDSFGQIFSHYLNNVNHQLQESEKLTAQLATGKVQNLHEVTIAAQKASISLQLTVQVRDKAIEAYQEIMRMQI